MSTLELQVLRRVVDLNPSVLKELIDHDQVYEYDGGDIYIVNDAPHDYVETNEIIRATTGFAVADSYGRILAGPFRDLARAESAKSGAKVQFEVEVEVPEEDDEEE